MRKKIAYALLGIGCSLFVLRAQKQVLVPPDLCGYWQNYPVDSRDCCGPDITPEYISFYSRIYYTDSVAAPENGRTVFYLRDNDGNRRELEITRLASDTISYTFTGWDTATTAVRQSERPEMRDISVSALPRALFTRWTSDNRGTVDCEFSESGRVRFHDAAWRIERVRRNIWSGEYELLLKNDDRYTFVYLDPITPVYLNGSSESRRFTMIPAADPSFYPILGAWIDPATHAWTYGFFENFAVYRNDFWDYESIRLKKNKGRIVLKKGDERLSLHVCWQTRNDSVCTISPAGGKKQTYIRYTELPGYPTPDTVSFRDTGYRPDSATIVGYFRGVNPRKPYELAIDNFLTGWRDDFYADFDSLGRFRLTVPLLNTSECFLDWRHEGLHTVLEPGETLFLYSDSTTGQVRFMGKNARFHQEMEQYHRSPEYKRIEIYDFRSSEEIPHAEYLRKQVGRYEEEKSAFEKFLVTHPQVSARFREFWKQQQTFSLAERLVLRRSALKRRFQKERFEPVYQQVVDSLFRRLPRPYSLVGSALNFVRDYIGYYHDLRDEPILEYIPTVVDAPRYLYRTGRLALSEQQLADLDTLEKGIRLAIELDELQLDSVEFGRRLQPYLAAENRLWSLSADSVYLAFLHSEEWNDFTTDWIEWLEIRSELGEIDSLVCDPLLREILITGRFLEILDENEKPLREDKLADFRKLVTCPELVEQVMACQYRYEASIREEARCMREEARYVESLERTEHLPECPDAGELFARLTELYRGKVICVYFWGTWTGYKDEDGMGMDYLATVKDALKDRDVIFMCFANRSPVTAWKNRIGECHLTGPNVVHYNLPDEQESMLEQYFSVTGFPACILIDRKGNIVDRIPPRSRLTSWTVWLVKTIRALLEIE